MAMSKTPQGIPRVGLTFFHSLELFMSASHPPLKLGSHVRLSPPPSDPRPSGFVPDRPWLFEDAVGEVRGFTPHCVLVRFSGSSSDDLCHPSFLENMEPEMTRLVKKCETAARRLVDRLVSGR